MSAQFEINAELRNDTGKGASRRLRREDMVPAILYGGEEQPTTLAVAHNQLTKSLEQEAFYSHILTVNFAGKSQKAVLKDVQRHPSKPRILHLDLQRVSETSEIRVHVPLHFIGEDVAPGVKLGGGIVNHLMTNVEVACLAKDLPEFIEVDVSALEAGHSIHLSELKLPAGVEIPELAQGPEHDLPVVAVVIPRGVVEAEEAEAEAPAAGEAGETPEGGSAT